jgi:hypothetical protein
MTPGPSLKAAALSLSLALGGGAEAAESTLTYTVEHPTYGNIGSHTDIYRDEGTTRRIDSQMRIAVKVLGIVVFREENDRSETWVSGRLQSVQSVSNRNGRRIEVRGERQPEGFIITTNAERKVAPADILPADPWALKTLGNFTVFAPRSGRVESVTVTGGENEMVTIQGRAIPTRRFHVNTPTQPDKWQVWMDQSGMAVKYRSIEEDSAIDFTLTTLPQAPAVAQPPAAPARR